MTDERVQRCKELVSRKQDTCFRMADGGSLRMNDRLLVPDISELRQALLRLAHCGRYSIHLGGKKMYKDLRSQFWWKGMKRDVIDLYVDVLIVNRSKMRGEVRFGMKRKLAPRYFGPYEILQQIGTLDYRLALPPSLSCIHDVFYVSMLRKYGPDPSHVLDISEVQLDPDVSYVERAVCILDRSEWKLRSKLIPMVKVQWEHRGVEKATWETERHKRKLYPYLF
ncbi:uncharacterized protein [Primulina eburnea]|uniref:uncharacterized protein n=1 Tax=Primulina eburnea TaxID=1245227 RepID=UPI003C6C2895